MSRMRIVVASLGLLVLVAELAYGQTYPNKPVRIVVSAPGGGTDFVARLMAQSLSGPLDQQVTVEYRGIGFLAAEFVSKAPPDGYTLHVNGANLWIAPLMQKLTYDVVRDFSPISLLVREISVLVVHPSLPVKSVKELIALAKAKPGDLSYSSSQVGGSSRLAMEAFKSLAGINVLHIPYKGAAAATVGLLSGQVQLSINSAPPLMPHVKTGKLRALGVTSAEPSPLAPGLPTVASGLPGYESVSMTGMLAPAKTPAAVINRLNQEVLRVLNQPDVKEKFFNGGAETAGGLPEEFLAIIKSDIARVGKIIKDAGIKSE